MNRKDAGFTPREINATIVGKLGENNGAAIFLADGSEVEFILKQNEQLQKLLSEGSGRLVKGAGLLAHETPEEHHAHPFTLAVEKFELLP